MLLKPGHRAADLSLPLVSGDRFTLSERHPENFTVLIFYRGYHCPICRDQLQALDKKIGEFGEIGTEIVAISMDPKHRAEKSVEEWGIRNVPVAYDMDQDDGAKYGLYFSHAINDGEPALFSEPGMAILRPDRTVYAAYTQSVPFARPSLDDLKRGLEFVLENNYPARGTAT